MRQPIEVIDGPLYQWDTGRKVRINCPEAVELHLAPDGADNAAVLEIREENGESVTDVPDEFLQRSGHLYAYLVKASDTGEYTKHAHSLYIHCRPKPEDYVYAPGEVKRWETLEERIAELEENGTGGSADAVLYTEQALTDEQRAQARANIAEYETRTFKTNYIYPYVVAETTGMFDWSCADTVAAQSEWGISQGYTSAMHDIIWAMQDAYDEFTAGLVMPAIAINYDALFNAGAIKDSDLTFINMHPMANIKRFSLDKDGTVYKLSKTLDNYEYRMYYYDSSTGVATLKNRLYTGDKTLSFSNNYADAKATGDAIAAAKKEVEAKIVQPDLSVNDESDPAYVKGRTHYEYDSRVEIPVSGSWIDEDSDGVADGFWITASLGLEPGKIYSVDWNGTEYQCIAQDLSSVLSGAICLGDAYKATEGQFGTSTGEPFAVLDMGADMGNGLYGMIAWVDTTAGSGKVPFAIYAGEKAVKKLENKYLNLDWFPTKGIKETCIAAEKTVTNAIGSGSITEEKGGFPDLTQNDVYAGQKLVVYWDGARYEVEVVGEVNTETGTEVTNFFARCVVGENVLFTLFFNDNYTMVDYTEGDSHVASVYSIETEYNKMPEGFLPESVGKVKTVNGVAPDESGNVEIEVGSGDGIPVPQTASVGQVISVKAVDENGKPTEWECVEFPLFQSYETLGKIITEERVKSIRLDLEDSIPCKMVVVRYGKVRGHSENTSGSDWHALRFLFDNATIDVPLHHNPGTNLNIYYMQVVLLVTPHMAVAWLSKTQMSYNSNAGQAYVLSPLIFTNVDLSGGLKSVEAGSLHLNTTDTMEIGAELAVIGVN